MIIQENIALAQYTTFKIGGLARYFCAVSSEAELIEAINYSRSKKLEILIIGGGSNLLISDSGFDGLVILMRIKGVEIGGIEKTKDNKVFVTVGAGEVWDEFVGKMVDEGLYGIENLSSIPGTVGASPVQNIGAYGVEVSSVIHTVRVFDRNEMKFIELSNADCHFSYRQSIFKEDRGHYIVTAVIFALSRDSKINIEYNDLKNYFSKEENVRNILNPKDIRKAVIEIRKNKLPDWKKWGTAGSFFKNPIISKKQFDELKNKYPELPGHIESDNRVKVSLGWILDKICESKGIIIGNVGTYEKQALVIVSKPGATSREVVDFSMELIKKVKSKTGLDIECEVEWVV